MYIKDKNIDSGKAFDFGRTSEDYAKFRDIYPQKFYDSILERNLCIKGQKILDLGTGTGVIPRNMYRYGAEWTGIDISENQIEQARILSENMNIKYYAQAVEDIKFPCNSFDVITACQCFWYFDHEKIMPELYNILKPNGSILILSMAWLPYEDKIAEASEKLVLKYNPEWSGAGETIHPIFIPECYKEKFRLVYREEYYLKVPFTRKSWNGRMKACRGVGASLTESEISAWECEHINLLSEIAPENFEVQHYAAIAELKAIK
ncbi:MAG: methyltransferase domain-containing protein [Prevotella sp.]|nr:methyltransferase domain-containing protein [Alistipes senegalensis]MCM1357267.1 methyltransferase domain-containing protein [Prevotella sp.]MCM1473173.1 methyltransferase domain-containing protein [Muribaculaceae bacterium]